VFVLSAHALPPSGMALHPPQWLLTMAVGDSGDSGDSGESGIHDRRLRSRMMPTSLVAIIDVNEYTYR
jgi:hypothetical protein